MGILEKTELKSAEAFRDYVRRLLTVRTLQERCEEANAAQGVFGNIAQMSNGELKQMTFSSWHKHARKQSQLRRVDERRGKTTVAWVETKRNAISQRKRDDTLRA